MGSLVIFLVIIYGLVPYVECDCNQKYIAERDGVFYITPPGYPGNFTQDTDCYYEISTSSRESGSVLHMEVMEVTLTCDDETSQLKVYDAFSRNPRYLGQVCLGGPTVFQSPRYTLYLEFRTQAQSQRSRGFKIEVRAEPKYTHCYTQDTLVLDVTQTPNTLTTPFYPYETAPEVNCQWLLKAPEGFAVNVTLLTADMKGSRECSNFGMFLYDGKTTYDDDLLAAVCEDSLRSIKSSGPYMLLYFKSSSHVYQSGGGVKLQYSTIPLEESPPTHISQTLFFVIAAILIALIIAIVCAAILKLVVLPRRRKLAERRRTEARPRMDRVLSVTSQTELLQAFDNSGAWRTHLGTSRPPAQSQGSNKLSLVQICRRIVCKKYEQAPRHYDRNMSGWYRNDGSGVLVSVPASLSAYGERPFGERGEINISMELPPSYEEAVGAGHPSGCYPDVRDCVTSQRVELQPPTITDGV